MRQTLALVITMHALCAAAYAQTSDGGFDKLLSPSLAATAKAMHATIRRDIAEAAEALPAEDFGFKPTPEVRIFAQLVGHLVNANFFFWLGISRDQGLRVSHPRRTGSNRRVRRDRRDLHFQNLCVLCVLSGCFGSDVSIEHPAQIDLAALTHSKFQIPNSKF